MRCLRSWFPVTLLVVAVSIAVTAGGEVRNDDTQQPPSRQTVQQQHRNPSHQHPHQQPHDRGGGGGSGPPPTGGKGADGSSHKTLPAAASAGQQQPQTAGSGGAANRMVERSNSYTVLSQAMSQAVHHEFGTYGSGSADGVCSADDMDCIAHHDQLGMEAIRSLHRQLDDDDNGDIDLSESDDFLREELKYDYGYEKRHKAFHFNDDMHISVKELWEAWLRSEVHNWTVDQTTEWLAQSVQLPQYVHLFRQHKVTGKVLPRLAVNNMHYVSNVLGIKDPIHKQKIALKAMDAVLFGPPRETGTRWKDLLLVTLLLTAIIGSWYAYQQNKNAKIHLKRMAKDVEGLLKAEVALKDMQKELERARLEQENVAAERMDLERRLREAPSISSSNSDLEVQQLKQEIEMLRSELSRAEVEINDHCWTPPQGLQNWLQLTFELENKQHIRKRIMAEKQLMSAREACEKLKKKRSSLVGAFVSTHGKSIDDVDRSIVEARNALNDVTNDLQERMFRWKQIEQMLGFTIVNNNGLAYLENLLYNRNGVGSKSYRSRLSSSQDDLDDDSVQGLYDGICRTGRDDSSASDDGDRGGERERDTVTFFLGGGPTVNTLNMGIISPTTASAYMTNAAPTMSSNSGLQQQQQQQQQFGLHGAPMLQQFGLHGGSSSSNSLNHSGSVSSTTPSSPLSSPLMAYGISGLNLPSMNESSQSLHEETLISSSSERTVPPRSKKAPAKLPQAQPGKAPMPPPRKTMSSQSLFSMGRSASSDLVSLESAALSLPPGAAAGLAAAAASSSSPGFGAGASVSTSASALQLQQFIESQQCSRDQQVQPGRQQPPSAPSSSAAPRNGGVPSGGPGSDGTATPGGLVAGPEFDTYSTDSSVVDEDVKRRRRKLPFSFGKKFSKTKKTQ